MGLRFLRAAMRDGAGFGGANGAPRPVPLPPRDCPRKEAAPKGVFRLRERVIARWCGLPAGERLGTTRRPMDDNGRHSRFPTERIEWGASAFLTGGALLSVTVVPAFIWAHRADPAIDWTLVAVVFVAFYVITGLSITVGYHRLFAHRAFRAAWPVRAATLLFGAGAFENSCLEWSGEHRRHHDEDDRDAGAHDGRRGMLATLLSPGLIKLAPVKPFTNVQDLEADPWVMAQHRHAHLLGVLVSLAAPFGAGYALGGLPLAWAMLLVPGVLRVTGMRLCAFLIHRVCHSIGRRPYSKTHSGRDNWVCSLFTFGEGYHNFHHAFQSDYRNGVKWWQFDPTKWAIRTLEWLGLASDLRRTPDSLIRSAEREAGGSGR